MGHNRVLAPLSAASVLLTAYRSKRAEAPREVVLAVFATCEQRSPPVSRVGGVRYMASLSRARNGADFLNYGLNWAFGRELDARHQ